MHRIPEPELMNEAEQAEAYARADFSEPHNRFITLFRENFPNWPGNGLVLDLGCGPGDIAMRFARAYPNCRVDGIDGAPAMLAVGYKILADDNALGRRVRLHQVLLPQENAPSEKYDAIISNSLLHHLHDPDVLWKAVTQYAKSGAPVFIIDLKRPKNRDEAKRLTDLYTVNAPEILRRDFFNSLLAAFTVVEVKEQIRNCGLSNLTVEAISDRHVMIRGFAAPNDFV